jgi:hypothetical protein
MLILDDRLTTRALLNDFSWIPDGHDSSNLATTTEFHFRLISGVLKNPPSGVHSTFFATLSSMGQARFRSRMLEPAPIVQLLDSRLSLNGAATLFATSRRMSMLICQALSAAAVHDAALAFSTITPAIELFCSEAHLDRHHIHID